MTLVCRRVVLYNPPSLFWTMPLALVAIGSALDFDRFEVTIVDGRLEDTRSSTTSRTRATRSQTAWRATAMRSRASSRNGPSSTTSVGRRSGFPTSSGRGWTASGSTSSSPTNGSPTRWSCRCARTRGGESAGTPLASRSSGGSSNGSVRGRNCRDVGSGSRCRSGAAGALRSAPRRRPAAGCGSREAGVSSRE